MGLFKKRYAKKVIRDNEFLKGYAIKVNGLLLYTEDNAKVTDALKAMMDDLQYTVPSADAAARGVERKIKKEFTELSTALQQDGWIEADVLMHIKNIRRFIIELNALR